MNEQALRVSLANSRDKSNEVLAQSHVGAEIKALIRDLLQIADNFQELMQHSAGVSADARVLKKRMEQVKSQSKVQENKVVQSQRLILSLATEIEMIGVETKQILKRRGAIENDPDAASANRIKSSAERIVSAVTTLMSAGLGES